MPDVSFTIAGKDFKLTPEQVHTNTLHPCCLYHVRICVLILHMKIIALMTTSMFANTSMNLRVSLRVHATVSIKRWTLSDGHD